MVVGICRLYKSPGERRAMYKYILKQLSFKAKLTWVCSLISTSL